MKLKKIKLRNDASILTQSELKLIRGGETFYYCRCKENEDTFNTSSCEDCVNKCGGKEYTSSCAYVNV